MKSRWLSHSVAVGIHSRESVLCVFSVINIDMETYKSVDVYQLEEEIFLHETAIESLNRKLDLINQQLQQENANLLAHKTKEAELNERGNFLRSNLEDQTR
jgi:hypothetical protein